jgi:hypothetical protein
VRVTVKDAYSNTVTSSAASIALAITSGTGTAGAALTGGGATPVTSGTGVATFSVSIDKAGTGYTLTATSPGLASALSNRFDIAN